ncbi:LytTR family transcriptional regulator [Clostridiales bacterium TF09-2AC]|nr:LytTR family transcriptional regulator [Clostridiales bacterium TF09-2AC]
MFLPRTNRSIHTVPVSSGTCTRTIRNMYQGYLKLVCVHISPASSTSVSIGFLSISDRHAEVYHICTEDIAYIEASNTYSNMCCCSGRILASQSVSSMEKHLPSYFMRTHHSFIANQQYVRHIYRYDIGWSRAMGHSFRLQKGRV